MTAERYLEALRPILSRVRTDITAVSRAGRMSWTKEPLNRERMLTHLQGGASRGVCPIKEGASTTRLALLDLDSHKGESTWAEMQQAATVVIDGLSTGGFSPVAFRSRGGRGIHIFLLWDDDQDAYSVRAKLAEELTLLGFSDGTAGVARGQIEIFPKQDSVGMGECGNQFILPLAGASEPLDPLFGLEPMGTDYVLTMDWPMSQQVEVRERPVRAPSAEFAAEPEPIANVLSALAAIPNSGEQRQPYQEWLAIVCAVHEATGASQEGYEAAYNWSAQYEDFKPKFFDNQVWNRIKDADQRSKAVTRATLFYKAQQFGWGSAEPTADGFEDEPVRLTRRQEPVWPAVAEFDSPGTFQCSGDLGTNAGSLVVVRDEIDLFEDEPQNPQVMELEPEEDLPAFERDKTGRIKAIIGNLTKAVGRPDIVGVQIGQDGFRDEIMVSAPGTNQWRPLGDTDYVWLRERLETGANGFCPISKEMIRDVVQAVAEKNKFDSAELWLNNLPYDGVSRCETFLRDYFGVEDMPYTRAVSLYMWTAMAGRVMEPGCKADMVPILVGDQGLGKSTAIGALVPSPEFFAEVSFAEKDDDLSRKMRGKLVAEIGELRGLHTKELEAIKAFVTRTHEQWIPKYREFGTTFPRRLIFIGSTNKDQFLADETGHRRWLPVRVSQVAVDKVREVAPLCWAEARRLFLAGGVQWKAAQELAKEIHDEYAFSDDWEEHVRKWIVDPIFGDEVALPRAFVTTTDALVEALGFDKRQIGRREEMRMAAVFRALGWERKRIQVEGVQKWRYVPTSG